MSKIKNPKGKISRCSRRMGQKVFGGKSLVAKGKKR